MISVEVLCRHMAWANQEIYKEVQKDTFYLYRS
jgi:hypothetical protein